jgi:hypothetical protein
MGISGGEMLKRPGPDTVCRGEGEGEEEEEEEEGRMRRSRRRIRRRGGRRQRSTRVTFGKPKYYQQHLPKLSKKVRIHSTYVTGA